MVIERDQESIAFEISITSTVEQEVANVEKCLQANFGQVILVSSARKFLSKVKEVISEKLQLQDLERIQFLCPEDLGSFFEELGARSAGNETRVRGYKVKVGYKTVSENEKKARKQAISQTILNALKRLKDSD